MIAWQPVWSLPKVRAFTEALGPWNKQQGSQRQSSSSTQGFPRCLIRCSRLVPWKTKKWRERESGCYLWHWREGKQCYDIATKLWILQIVPFPNSSVQGCLQMLDSANLIWSQPRALGAINVSLRKKVHTRGRHSHVCSRFSSSHWRIAASTRRDGLPSPWRRIPS